MSFGSIYDPTPWENPEESKDPGSLGEFPDQKLPDCFARILDGILHASGDGESVNADPNYAKLLSVALKYRSMDFCVDPILLELVRVLLVQFQGITEARRLRLEHTVASSLAEDQVSLERLQHLWCHMKGLVSNAE